MAIEVFVSAGTPANDSQKTFRDTIVKAVEITGLSTRFMTDRDWDYKNPLRGVRRAMEDCSGAVVIAYRRYRFPSGEELRSDGVRSLQEVSFPTPWNQIEAAMAYERGFPLLIIAETGLRQDAFLETTNDVRPFWADPDKPISDSQGFLGYLQSWKRDVEDFATKKSSETQRPEQVITVKRLLSSLPWYQLLALVVTILTVLATVASIGYRVGSGQWPFG